MVWFGVVDRVTYRGLVISADQTLDDPETRFQCGEVTTLESRDPIFQMTKCNLGTPGFFVGFPPPPATTRTGPLVHPTGRAAALTDVAAGKKRLERATSTFPLSSRSTLWEPLVRHCKSIVNRLTAKPNGRMVSPLSTRQTF